jgi:hypothetical protein
MATGLPRFVMTIGSPDSATRSMSSRHLALNWPALTAYTACAKPPMVMGMVTNACGIKKEIGTPYPIAIPSALRSAKY